MSWPRWRGVFSDPAAMSDAMPNGEATGAAGSAGTASRGDHQHPRMSSAKTGTLDGNGEATVTFGRVFDSAPVLAVLFEEAANNQPVIVKRKTWVQDGNGKYTGVVLKGYRLQKLPSVLALLSALINYDIAAGSAAGVGFDLVAIPPG